jgi:acyl-homoserine-lactone acylase
MKIFIDPADMKARYESSPAWLKALMNSWADGLNYYLYKHPEVKPKVITQFEPWMALTFSEGSIGGDIERVNLNQLEEFYGKTSSRQAMAEDIPDYVEPTGSNGIAVAPSNTTTKHALLLINPHTSFFFRAEAQMVSDGIECVWRADLGQFFIYQGFNDRGMDAHVKQRGQHRRIRRKY